MIDFRCDCCGRFIGEKDFDKGATKQLLKDNKSSDEDELWETICIKCNEHPRNIEL